jgi:hypothetical protein
LRNRNLTAAIAVALMIAFAAVACLTDYTQAQKTFICQQSILTLVKPECVRLSAVADGAYVDLCNEISDDAVKVCDVGFGGDPVELCSSISAKASQCAVIAEGDTSPSDAKLQNIATCERVANAAGLACVIALTTPVPTPEPTPLPE